MPSRVDRRFVTVVGMAAALVLILGSGASRAEPAPQVSASMVTTSAAQAAASLYACVRNQSGRMRIIQSGSCEKGEYLVAWSLVGPPGVRGARGPTGAGGPVGQIGPAGPQGPVGPPDGSTVLSGEGQPSVTVGEPGDFYVDLQTWSMWGPKSNETWPLGTNLIGPSGPSGGRGLSGAQGAQGAQGPPGAQGDPGGFGAYGSFDDTATVTISSVSGIPIPLRGTAFAQGVSIVDSTQVTMAAAGVYNLAASLQLLNNSNQARIVTIWLSRNGAAIPLTAADVYLGTDVTGERTVAALSYIFASAPGDSFELMITANGGSTELFYGPSRNSDRGAPEVPSSIITINQVG
jgi:hypothetical protein